MKFHLPWPRIFGNKRFFIILFIIVHIILAFLQIYKQTIFVKISYQKQKNDKLLAELLRQKISLMQQLEAIKNKTNVKKYALNELEMDKIKIENIKKLV